MCLSVISTDSVYGTGKNCFPQVFLEKYKYFFKQKQMPNYITDDMNISSDDSDRKESDYSDEENSNE